MALEKDLEQNLWPHLHGKVWGQVIVELRYHALRQRRSIQVRGYLKRKAEEVSDLHVDFLLLDLELAVICSSLNISADELGHPSKDNECLGQLLCLNHRDSGEVVLVQAVP